MKMQMLCESLTACVAAIDGHFKNLQQLSKSAFSYQHQKPGCFQSHPHTTKENKIQNAETKN